MKSVTRYRSNNLKKQMSKFVDDNVMVIVYDLETTGLHPDVNHIIELSARKCFISDDGLEEVESAVWYMNPGYSLPENIVALTGITDEMLADKPQEAEVIDEIVEFFDSYPVMGYNNQRFDDQFMEAMYDRYGIQFMPEDTFDVYKAACDLIEPGETKNMKLATVAEYFGLTEQIERFHNAESDTIATMLSFNRLYQICKEKLSQNSGYTNLIRCNVRSVQYWVNPHNTRMKYLFVNTDSATFRYDQAYKCWTTKDTNDRIERYDMEDVIDQVINLTGVKNEEDLNTFKGSARSRIA